MKKDRKNIGGWVLVAIFFALNGFIIFNGTKYLIHSDGATAVLLAREQWMQKKMYPVGWCYGTDIWNIGLNTLILPFFRFCRHWTDARACAVIIQTMLMILLILGFQKAKILGDKIWMVVLCMLLPISEVVSEHWYFQATYMTLMIFLGLMILFTYLLFSSKNKVRIAGTILLTGVLCLRISMGYMMVLVFVFPMIMTIIIQLVRERYQEITDVEKRANTKKYLWAAIILTAGTFLGVAYNYYLIHTLNYAGNATSGYQFIDYREIHPDQLLQGLLRLYGAADKGAGLLSRSGILKAFSFAYMILMLFMIPYQLIRGFDKLKNEYQRIFIFFSGISSFAVAYLYIFTGMDQSRYLLWIYFYTIILGGIWLDNYELFQYRYKKEIKWVITIFFAALFGVVYLYYMTYDYDNNPDVLGVNNDNVFYKADYGLVEYLEEKGYTFGYAPYWTAYSNYVISDGKVRLAALELDWTAPYLWLTSEKWYEEEAHEGDCFIVIGDDMFENLPEEYKEKASAKDRYEEYTIYKYENIGILKQIWKDIKRGETE